MSTYTNEELHDEGAYDEYEDLCDNVPEGWDKLSRVEKIQYILDHKTAYCIDGVLVDMQSANAFMTVYNYCEGNEERQAILAEKLSLVKAVEFCWRCVK